MIAAVNQVIFEIPSRENRDYLGLIDKGKTARIADVDAAVVVLEVFSMYCPVCQKDAPHMNEVVSLIQEKELGRHIKIIGFGFENSAFEVEVFKKKFNIPFPLIPDPENEVMDQLGVSGTPYYIVLNTKNPKAIDIYFTQDMPVKNARAFLKKIERAAKL